MAPIHVTRDTYVRAECDRTFFNVSGLAGGVNRFFHYREVTPLDKQTVIRMNKDTLYSAAVVDTSRGAVLTIPPLPADRYVSVLLIDNDHYSPGVLYTSGTHELPRDTKYLFVALRIQVKDPSDPGDLAFIHALQDRFTLRANSADPFPRPEWDAASLSALTRQYEQASSQFQQYPAGAMAPRGKADERVRHLAAAGAWGLFPVEHAVYINYNGHHDAARCYRATYQVPDHHAFWSITLYGADGYMKSADSVLNATNTQMNTDGSFTVHFGSRAACGQVANRLETTDGWNFLMRIYRPGPSVVQGQYRLPVAQPCLQDAAMDDAHRGMSQP